MKRKTRIERVYNEDTGWFETREVELNSYSFTDDDRIMIVQFLSYVSLSLLFVPK